MKESLEELLAAWDALAQDITLRLLPWRSITPGLDERLYRMREALERARAEIAIPTSGHESAAPLASSSQPE